MTKKDEKKPVSVDLGLGSIFKGIEGFIELANKLAESGEEIKGAREIKDIAGVKGSKAIYGYNVRVGLKGKPVVDTFGNIKKTEKGVVVKDEREPLVDVFDEKDEVKIVAELPGVAQKDIKLNVKQNKLTISVETKERKYYKEVKLPCKVKGKLDKTYKNGVLEVRLKKGNGGKQ
ncbi:MAG: archaeal heat shock protein Hsp20 [Nanoarchaeota archaeon]